jgi:C4-dicarboxylate transporter DctQ subunit
MGGFFRKLDAGLARVEEAFLALALAVMVLVVFGDFVLRETVNRGWVWAKELASYLMVWVGFLGASLATHRRRHLVMSLAGKIFPPRIRKWTAFSAALITAAVSLYLSWLGYRYVQETRSFDERSLALGIPIWWVQAAIPLAFALVGLRFLGAAGSILGNGPATLGDSGPAIQDAGKGPPPGPAPAGIDRSSPGSAPVGPDGRPPGPAPAGTGTPPQGPASVGPGGPPPRPASGEAG